jgi:hypothetical protein
LKRYITGTDWAFLLALAGLAAMLAAAIFYLA